MPEHEQAGRIAALLERASRLLNNDCNAQGVLPVHWESLRYLNEANQFSRTLAGLAAFLGSTKGTVSQTLKALEQKGLIEKEVDATDRRSKRLSLTRKGRKLLEQDPLADWLDEIGGLPQRERAGLEDGLTMLLRSKLAERGRAPFGQCRDCVYFIAEHPEGGPHYCDLLKVTLSQRNAQQICSEQEPRQLSA